MSTTTADTPWSWLSTLLGNLSTHLNAEREHLRQLRAQCMQAEQHFRSLPQDAGTEHRSRLAELMEVGAHLIRINLNRNQRHPADPVMLEKLEDLQDLWDHHYEISAPPLSPEEAAEAEALRKRIFGEV